MAYDFRPMQIADIARVSAWRATPLVSKWCEGEIDADDLADPISRQWIVSHQDQPFAFLQDYDPHAEPAHPFAFLPPASRGLDQFIGDPDMLGLGHGPAFVDLFVAALFAGGAPAVGVDPNPDNTRAIRAYQKASFQAGECRDTPWGRCLLMTRYRT